ncbi:hypothetical protein LC605_26890 [Nostoc sp. CHAB 5836]|uniref:hypothetical protein n=1 Tax=Nostoc sp. CHAB 5836 TaxID=2780404 RepID=UPI001E282B95|nr:hypothetical protein [Nostoc sp. CHAB 5836]MCC5618652.1 hypothetical protein [Nostoc sp. CHAB 5836]
MAMRGEAIAILAIVGQRCCTAFGSSKLFPKWHSDLSNIKGLTGNCRLDPNTA